MTMMAVLGVLPALAGMVAIAAVVTTVIAEVIAQGATGTATQGGADQAAGTAAHAVADHVATGRAQATANGRLGTIAAIRAQYTPCCTPDAGTDGRTSAAADLLADQRTEHAAHGATESGFGIARISRGNARQG